MALSESIEYDKIEVVGLYKAVQVRKASVIKKDGVELTRSFNRFVLDPGTLDESDNLVDNPLTKEPDGTTDITDEIVNKYTQFKVNKGEAITAVGTTAIIEAAYAEGVVGIAT